MDAEVHEANAIPNKCFVQLQGNMRPCGKETDGMSIHLETAKQLNHIRGFKCRILLPLGAPSECIIGEFHGLARLKGTPEDLLEILDIDSGVVLMEAKKRFVTCMVMQERYPRAISSLGIRRLVF